MDDDTCAIPYTHFEERYECAATAIGRFMRHLGTFLKRRIS